MNNLEYINSSSAIITSEIPKKIISFLTILIITFTTFIIFGLYYEYPKYLNYQGNIVRENETYLIKILIMEEDLMKIKKGKLMLNKGQVNYSIHYINPVYMLDNSEHKYYEVFIKSVLSKELRQEHLPVLIKFELPKTTLIKEFTSKIKKGMM